MLPKGSFVTAGWAWAVGDCMPPKKSTFDAEGCCLCCVCGAGAAGFGADAYRDKIEFLRSALPVDAGAVVPEVAEDGLGGADCVLPKKSIPSKLSPALVCFGGAAGAFAGAALIAGSVVLGLAGAASSMSPNKSTCCLLGGCGTLPMLDDPFLKLPARSIVAFSRTTFNGTSSSADASLKVLGSGIGPSITHLLLSYFVLMKFSIFASLGTCPGASLSSQYLFALPLPHLSIEANCSSVQLSRSTDLTREICTPIERWIPEQRMHTKTPMFQDAHRGCLLRLQSAHVLLDSSLTSCLSVARFCAERSTGRLDMMSMCWWQGSDWAVL
jgi:hypothetical protein